MKKVLVSLFLMALVSSNVFAAEVYVDLMRLFNDYKKTVAFDEELAKKQEEKEGQLQKKQEKIMSLQKEAELLKDDARTRKEDEIAKLGGELQQEYQQSLAALKEERDKKMEEVLVDIEGRIAEYAKDNGYDYIFKKAALAYADEANDKTDEVLELLNQ